MPRAWRWRRRGCVLLHRGQATSALEDESSPRDSLDPRGSIVTPVQRAERRTRIRTRRIRRQDHELRPDSGQALAGASSLYRPGDDLTQQVAGGRPTLRFTLLGSDLFRHVRLLGHRTTGRSEEDRGRESASHDGAASPHSRGTVAHHNHPAPSSMLAFVTRLPRRPSKMPSALPTTAFAWPRKSPATHRNGSVNTSKAKKRAHSRARAWRFRNQIEFTPIMYLRRGL